MQFWRFFLLGQPFTFFKLWVASHRQGSSFLWALLIVCYGLQMRIIFDLGFHSEYPEKRY